MRKVIVTDVADPYKHLKGKIGFLDIYAAVGYKLYRVSFSDKVTHYLYRNEFEYLEDYLLKYWLED